MEKRDITIEFEYRPWGKFETFISEDGYQVKRLIVIPGAKLSLQSHKHRSEHWIVVRGEAKVTNGKEETILKKNEHIFIPIGNIHRIENPGKSSLEIIEIQSGDYLGEDDIVRYEDIYNRIEEK